jgi:hypothetical protein
MALWWLEDCGLGVGGGSETARKVKIWFREKKNVKGQNGNCKYWVPKEKCLLVLFPKSYSIHPPLNPFAKHYPYQNSCFDIYIYIYIYIYI